MDQCSRMRTEEEQYVKSEESVWAVSSGPPTT